jgi:hypothetical protein
MSAKPTIHLFCKNKNELSLFLSKFYNTNIENSMEEFSFDDPMQLIDLISLVVDNNDKYNISAWVNLDEDIFIKVTNSNINDIIKYIYERYPY